MKKSLLNIISVLLVLSVIFSFASCGEKPQEAPPPTTVQDNTKPVSHTEKISELPTDPQKLTDMFNSALDYVELYCYAYTKTLKCKVDRLNIGRLADVDGGTAAFRSVFGETDLATTFDYNTSKDLFSKNFIASGFEPKDFTKISAVRKNKDIILTAEFPDENNPSEKSGHLHILSNDFTGIDKLNSALSQFASSAGSAQIRATNIKAVATIDSDSSRLKKLVISYREDYSLSEIKLVKIEGSAASGSAFTTVTYTDIG